MSLFVCAIDIDDRKLAHAKRLGADFVVNAHGVLITAPSLVVFKQAVGMTRKLGTCVLVGRGRELRNHPGFVRWDSPGRGRSARIRSGRQGEVGSNTAT